MREILWFRILSKKSRIKKILVHKFLLSKFINNQIYVYVRVYSSYQIVKSCELVTLNLLRFKKN